MKVYLSKVQPSSLESTTRPLSRCPSGGPFHDAAANSLSVTRWRRLDERAERFVVAERAQVREQSLDVLGRWQHEVRATGIVVVAADPALCRPDAPGDVGVRSCIASMLAKISAASGPTRRPAS